MHLANCLLNHGPDILPDLLTKFIFLILFLSKREILIINQTSFKLPDHLSGIFQTAIITSSIIVTFISGYTCLDRLLALYTTLKSINIPDNNCAPGLYCLIIITKSSPDLITKPTDIALSDKSLIKLRKEL